MSVKKAEKLFERFMPISVALDSPLCRYPEFTKEKILAVHTQRPSGFGLDARRCSKSSDVRADVQDRTAGQVHGPDRLGNVAVLEAREGFFLPWSFGYGIRFQGIISN